MVREHDRHTRLADTAVKRLCENPTPHLRRFAQAQFLICSQGFEPRTRVSASLIAHYSSLENLP